MFRAIKERLRQGYRTHSYPAAQPNMPGKFIGLPVISDICAQNCSKCIEICPTGALSQKDSGIKLDMGKCIFCGECSKICPENVISFTNDHRISSLKRETLEIGKETFRPARALEESARVIFENSFKLRQVSAGGCNACEADTNVLNTLVYDLGRFGIQFVASPRHADGLLVTGPVTANMKLALQKTYDALPAPKLVIAVGACAISGGIYQGHEEISECLDMIIPVDLYIPGCPPNPWTILDGILRLLGKTD